MREVHLRSRNLYSFIEFWFGFSVAKSVLRGARARRPNGNAHRRQDRASFANRRWRRCAWLTFHSPKTQYRDVSNSRSWQQEHGTPYDCAISRVTISKGGDDGNEFLESPILFSRGSDLPSLSMAVSGTVTAAANLATRRNLELISGCRNLKGTSRVIALLHAPCAKKGGRSSAFGNVSSVEGEPRARLAD